MKGVSFGLPSSIAKKTECYVIKSRAESIDILRSLQQYRTRRFTGTVRAMKLSDAVTTVGDDLIVALMMIVVVVVVVVMVVV